MKKIAECCDILDNLRIPINDEVRQTIQGNIPYYGANGIQGYIDKYIFDEDLILLAEDGGNFEEYHTRPIAYKISGKSWVNNHAHILKVKNGYSHDFIFYSLVHKDITKYLNSGTRSKLNKSELEKIEIVFPATKTEEDEIAKILSTADAVIEKTEAAIAKYKAIKQGMLQDLFTRGIDISTNKLRPFFDDAPELYKESKLGMIPREWDEKELFNYLLFISYGFTNPMPETQEGLYLVTAANVNEGRILYETSRKTSRQAFENLLTEKSRPKVNDILLTKDGTLGRVAIVEKENLCINQSVAVLRPNKFIEPIFLKILLESPTYQKIMLDDARGSAIKHIYITDVNKMLVAIPQVEEQQRITANLQSISNKLQIEQTYLHKMQSLKKGLMEDLLSGKKQVKIQEELAKQNQD